MTEPTTTESTSRGKPRHVTIGGAPEGYDARLVLKALDEAAGPVIHVARDDKRVEAMRAALAFFAPEVPVLVFPAWDCLPYDRVSPNPDISAARMATLAALVQGAPARFVLRVSGHARLFEVDSWQVEEIRHLNRAALVQAKTAPAAADQPAATAPAQAAPPAGGQ